MMALRILRTALWAASVAGLAAAAAWSVRLGRADAWFRTETVAGTGTALSLTPDRAEYSVRLALLVSDGDPARAEAALRRAVALNPRDAGAWIELGLRYEAGGNLPPAERALLRAAQESRLYLPRWTLMNYYYRRHDAERFWQWAGEAVPMAWGDPLPLFQLCGRVREDGELIARLDIRQPEWRAAYLFYLLDAGHAELAGPAVRRLIEDQRAAGAPLLLAACDRLLGAGRPGDARAIWDGLIAARQIPGGTGRSRSGALLYNGDFAMPPIGRGFDWRLSEIEGVGAAREEAPVGLRLTFSGGQPENTEPLAQLAPVEPDTAYELRFNYRTSGIAAEAGPNWRIDDATRGSSIAAGESLASEETAAGRVPFVTPPGCRLVRVALACQRRPGATRISGFIVLRNVELRRAAQPPSGDPSRSRVMK
jgi:tetratricopeptide (TPR) repeat protein